MRWMRRAVGVTSWFLVRGLRGSWSVVIRPNPTHQCVTHQPANAYLLAELPHLPLRQGLALEEPLDPRLHRAHRRRLDREIHCAADFKDGVPMLLLLLLLRAMDRSMGRCDGAYGRCCRSPPPPLYPGAAAAAAAAGPQITPSAAPPPSPPAAAAPAPAPAPPLDGRATRTSSRGMDDGSINPVTPHCCVLAARCRVVG